MLKISQYEQGAAKTAVYPKEHGLVYAILGLTNEAGEVAGKFKKMYRDDNAVLTEERKAQLIDELGDVMWYAACVARELGTTLEEVCLKNLFKLYDRQARGKLTGDGDKR